VEHNSSCVQLNGCTKEEVPLGSTSSELDYNFTMLLYIVTIITLLKLIIIIILSPALLEHT
jgi:hypothetical protein